MQTTTNPSSIYSSIRINLVNRESLRAMASCLVGGAIYVTGIRVVEGKNGVFVAMPQRKASDGSYQDVAYPCSKEKREELQRAILDAFEKAAHSSEAIAA
jgi:stage V sporulation protein G